MGELELGEELWGEWESPEWSGAGERQGVDGPGERLWVGEPDRLSLEDTDCWKPEEKLLLLFRGAGGGTAGGGTAGGGGCLDSFFQMLRLLPPSCPSFLRLLLLRRAILAL